ncbi:Rossmann-like and DUF2520 domain-containing protein [Carboxylicivirga sp. M1479]|uniref:Rossmann-like and DUF2520 domain-containing protein n=1 Tax=Carboxylicivirga sp. M1479 TaxID=2594476 RepID=UPI001177CCE6|nr:Rossmann-like and DUF2520 domain-containing protein [Carboxylicivirga sp. M1479]TRX66100.1 DUF2520 domain-containing protein [Carboxylicivirga sp. M1479]
MKIVIIGSGNVATHLAVQFKQVNHDIAQVFSRNIDNANALAQKVNADPINQIEDVDEHADLYVISINDDALVSLIEQFPHVNGVVVHTAGSVSINVLQRFENYGVFYPFQTFSKETPVEFKKVPLLIEANSNENTAILLNLAKSLSNNVQEASSKQRGDLHIAAVFACNFVNHMYRVAEETLQESGLSFDLLHPLITETANKVLNASPGMTQTGPASRNDRTIIEKHLNSLESKQELRDIYQMLSECIVKRNA